ncbi:MAG: NAD(+) diphosphatase [Cyanobacteria bacterium P01_A01_bin.116]
MYSLNIASMILSQPFSISTDFVPATQPKPGSEIDLPAWWFFCQGSNLVTPRSGDEDNIAIPQAQSIEALNITPVRTQFLGYLNNRACIAAELPKDTNLPCSFTLQSLRKLHGMLEDDLFAIAARAVQITEWDRTHQYCGHCATPTIQLPTERAKRCGSCQLRQYPRLSPAVIMLISKGEQLLLARAPRFRNGMYSVLAGFVEPGESLEETVAREVREEVGIEIKNIRYFGSQPWPFPNSLMVGFTAEYASGTLTPDPTEIEAADWFNKRELPPVPGKLSIARKLIDSFVNASVPPA